MRSEVLAPDGDDDKRTEATGVRDGVWRFATIRTRDNADMGVVRSHSSCKSTAFPSSLIHCYHRRSYATALGRCIAQALSQDHLFERSML